MRLVHEDNNWAEDVTIMNRTMKVEGFMVPLARSEIADKMLLRIYLIPFGRRDKW